jgi:glycosyltransferase involved in cell wall biosynthesis
LCYHIRNKINQFQFTRSQRVKQAFEATSIILAQTSSDVERIRQVYGRKAILCHEQGIGQFDTTIHAWDGRRPLRIVWVARCIAGKALSVLLQAIEGLKELVRIELHVIGDGAELRRWKRQAIRRKVNSRYVWHGRQTPQQTRAIMEQSDIIAFTRILEGTTATIMEALALGLGAIALKHCGFEDMTDSDCGILIPCKEKNQIVADYRKAITSLLTDPHRLAVMSEAAIKRGQLYTWDSIAKKIHDIYYRTLQGTCQLDETNLTCVYNKMIHTIETQCLTPAPQS